jgi:hypothetical protein
MEESLTLCGRAHGPATVSDLRFVAEVLVELDRGDEALALMERIVREAGSAATSERGHALVGYGRLLLLHGRLDDALAVLQEASAHSRKYGDVDVAARYLLFDVLGEAGRYHELEKHAAEDLWLFALLARFNLANRQRYIALLAALSRFWSLAGWTRNRQNTDASLEVHKRILHRQMARRRALLRVMEAIERVCTAEAIRGRTRSTARSRRQRAVYEAELEAAVAAKVADVERCRRLGDTRALAESLAQLAEARWRTGGQRSAALTVQREVVDLTRQLAEEDPGGMRPLLARRLLRFAEWAEVIGLRSDAQAARTEADRVVVAHGHWRPV